MKHFSFEPLKEWFGYTRRERRSSFILLMLIAAVAGIRFIIPNRKMSVEIIPLDNFTMSADSSRAKNVIALDQVPQMQRSYRPEKVINLNKCDSAALESLPGLGPVLSARIIKYRNLLGGFADISQLKEVYGLPEETYDLISARLKADPADVRKININTADFKQLLRLPYFDRYEVASILKYRELQGRILSGEELVGNGILTAEKIEKVKWYLEFEE
ncbi:MAG TPA: hypothetical protein DDW27_04930 [Bacteroidales bacterium]|nr:hypothetical protein [Bacteroidales bacterium]